MVFASGLLFGFVMTAEAARYLQLSLQTANPIRKVVTMLQDIEQKVRDQAKEDEELHKKYMCYCETSGKEVSERIANANVSAPQLGESITQAQAQQAGLDEAVAKEKADRAATQRAIEATKADREKAAAASAAKQEELGKYVAAINKSVNVISSGAYGTFLQTSTAETLRNLLSSQIGISENDRSDLFSFLSDTQSDGFAPSSGEVIGILKQLGDQFAADLESEISAEKNATREYAGLMAAKKEEKDALTEAIERKMTQSAELGVKIVMMQHDLEDAQETLIEDQKFQKDLKANCGTKRDEWDEIVATRNAELAAIADAVKVLSDDDALELFKKTLPGESASFMQINGEGEAKARALEIVRTASAGSAGAIGQRGVRHLDFLALMLQGKKVDFTKVIQMVDEMVSNLKNEQGADDSHVEYCRTSIDREEDKQKGSQRTISELETRIYETNEDLSAATDKIKGFKQEQAELDKSVAEATEQRKAENALFAEETQDNKRAKELLGLAKNRLQKFYNPKLYVPDTPPPPPAPGTADAVYNAFSFLELSAGAPVETPPTYGYAKKAEENNGVFAMIDLLVKDLDKELTQSDTAEKSAQAAYEELMSDSAAKRVTLDRELTQLNDLKSKLESALVAHNTNKAASAKELMAVEKLLSQLHADCDWLMKYYDARKAARTNEIESLGEAKAVLSGANYALLQIQGE